jgi:hypothetical protein
MIGYQQTIQSEYSTAPTIGQFLACMNAWLDQAGNINNFYNNVWDIATATGYGLDVWGRILGVSRVLNVASGTFFGFSNADDTNEVGFSQNGIFYMGQAATGNYALTDQSFLTLLYAKALANIWDGSIPGLNNILLVLFGASGDAWVTDNQNMTMTYSFSFTPTPVQQAIINSGVIPRSVGVLTSIAVGV